MTAADAFTIRPAEAHDADAIGDIRMHAIRTLPGLFSDEEPTPSEMNEWFADYLEAGTMLVAVQESGQGHGSDGDVVLGYASVAPLRPKNGYNFTGEDSIYLAENAQGRGIGTALLGALISHARDLGYHSLVGLIEAGNTRSLALHSKLGFTTTGSLKDAGWKFDQWWDLVMMQKML